MTRVLLLAGTREARQIAGAVAQEERVSVVASLAGATRTPKPLGIPTRIGGFGGRDGFLAYLRDERIGAVLDATHPFAVGISHRTAEICAERDIPYLLVLRQPWMPGPQDTWTFLHRESDAARHVPEGARVFLATGRQRLEAFANLTGRTLFVRQIDPPSEPFPYPGGRFVVGRPPFSIAEEVALFERLRIDWLVVRNSGGTASRSKLDAARRLGLPVAMIRRPLQPEAPKVETVAAALSWLRRLP
ncbi:cobalt-precorrin-6A reductase [Rhodobacteraceae bacterium CCMM004]|nr:cobalt-precorrin-6A reductase [Rhodobacteraceae bacterium CCMM004]